MTAKTKGIQSDIRQQITVKIVEALRSGDIPFWRKNWGTIGVPANAVTGRAYQGINRLLLAMGDQKWWATYNQWRSIGCQVKRNEKATKIVFYRPFEKIEQNEFGEDLITTYPVLRTFSVFHEGQIEGDFPGKCERGAESVDFAPAEEVFHATRADVRFGGDQAFYSPRADFIQMPNRELFCSPCDFYSVYAHELCHWTGHKSRLDRFPTSIGANSYAFEELVAELGSTFLCSELRIPSGDDLSNVVAYLDSWLQVLESNANAIFKAASLANKAADYILSLSNRSVLEESGED